MRVADMLDTMPGADQSVRARLPLPASSLKPVQAAPWEVFPQAEILQLNFRKINYSNIVHFAIPCLSRTGSFNSLNISAALLFFVYKSLFLEASLSKFVYYRILGCNLKFKNSEAYMWNISLLHMYYLRHYSLSFRQHLKNYL